MKLKNKPKILKSIAESSETPSDFIKYVMALQNMTGNIVTKNIDMTMEHFYVALSSNTIGFDTCIKIAKGLDIDPKILGRVIADYNIKKRLEKLENGTN